MNKETLESVIYLIHACSHKWGQSPACVYKKLQKADCIDEYLIPHYEVLHTQSTDFVVTDIEEYLEARGNVA